MSIRRNTIGHLCALSGLLCGQDVRLELKNNPHDLALFTSTGGQIQIHPLADQKFICVHPTDLFLLTSARMER